MGMVRYDMAFWRASKCVIGIVQHREEESVCTCPRLEVQYTSMAFFLPFYSMFQKCISRQ
jgi:hypothetical protein